MVDTGSGKAMSPQNQIPYIADSRNFRRFNITSKKSSRNHAVFQLPRDIRVECSLATLRSISLIKICLIV